MNNSLPRCPRCNGNLPSLSFDAEGDLCCWNCGYVRTTVPQSILETVKNGGGKAVQPSLYDKRSMKRGSARSGTEL